MPWQAWRTSTSKRFSRFASLFAPPPLSSSLPPPFPPSTNIPGDRPSLRPPKRKRIQDRKIGGGKKKERKKKEENGETLHNDWATRACSVLWSAAHISEPSRKSVCCLCWAAPSAAGQCACECVCVCMCARVHVCVCVCACCVHALPLCMCTLCMCTC